MLSLSPRGWCRVVYTVPFPTRDAYFSPTELRAAEAAELDITAAGTGQVELGDEYQAAVGISANLLVLVAIFVMVIKPL